MIALVKTHASIGKSILTVEKAFELPQDEVILVEDSMAGFRSAKKLSEKTGKPLRFGLRLETKCSSESSKLIYFARNSEGVDSLRRLYTKTFTKGGGVYELKKEELKGIQVAVPFYDSYISKNLFHFGIHDLDLEGLNPWYFEEDNGHPFDFLISRALKKQKIETIKAKSIYYEKREDFAAFQFYKAVCQRKAGRPTTFERPQLEYFCSDQFCWEDYLDKRGKSG